MSKEGMDDGLQPAHAGVVVHVIGNVGMEGPQQGEVAVPGIIHHVQTGAVGDGDVDDGGVKVVQLGADRFGEGKPHVVLGGGIFRIEQKGYGYGIVEEEDPPVGMVGRQGWGKGVGVALVAGAGGEDAHGPAGRQYLLLDFAYGQGHSALYSFILCHFIY